MDAHSLKVLEYDQIVSMLRERTACALGDDAARLLQPSADMLAIDEGQRETTEALGMLREEGGMPLGGIHDLREDVTRAARDAVLLPGELLNMAGTLSSGRRLRAFVLKRSEKYPKLSEIAANIGEFPRIEEAVSECISENAEVRDTASPELARVRTRLKTIHTRMLDKLQSIIHSADYRTVIQEPVITQRGDRYCIPVKAEYRHAFQGIVHDSSASGATVFVEPASVVEMGNDLKDLSLKEQQEVERILHRLSGMIGSAQPEIDMSLSALARLDFISAKAKLSADMDGVEPALNRDGKLELIHARHPLLTGDVVPIDVELGKRFTALLITGPNTGGKTVTLKTIGLLALMAQSGLHIPARHGSEVAVFDQIFADIGDEQSIQQSLSTFSSHMTKIVQVLGSLRGNSLVLLDEIGAGTDPEEGAALAKSILGYFIDRNARVVATTHYGELKEFAFVREGIENASVEFDVQTLRPTYRLMIGVPGSSNALDIASRLGLPLQVIQSARELMRGQDASEEIIRKIEQTHRAAAEKEQLAERTSRDVEILRSRYEERLQELEALRGDMRRQLAEEVDRRVQEKVAEMDAIIADLKQQPLPEPRKLHETRERFKKQVKEIREEIEELVPPVFDDVDEPFTLKLGDRVWVSTLEVEGELLNDPGEGDAHLQIGAMKVNVPFSVLRPARRPAEKPVARESEVTDQIASSKAVGIASELKLIAQRVDPALDKLDKYLDDAWLAGLTSVRIVHGKGTGALRKAVWEFLSNHHSVESYRLGEPEEGGAGATIAKLKER